MPMPHPTKDEDLKSFTKKFMGDPVMVKDYPDIKQRYAVMMSVWKKAHEKAEGAVNSDNLEGFIEYCAEIISSKIDKLKNK